VGRVKPEFALCGRPYHWIKSCLDCHRLYMRQQREKRNIGGHGYGFKGPECLECGGIRAKVAESGYTDDGQRIRRRICLDCGQDCASVEVYVDPEQTTFWKLNGGRMRRKREGDYRRKGKGIFRAPVKWRNPDKLLVTVTVVRDRSRDEEAA
jgi:hypothetical protein